VSIPPLLIGPDVSTYLAIPVRFRVKSGVRNRAAVWLSLLALVAGVLTVVGPAQAAHADGTATITGTILGAGSPDVPLEGAEVDVNCDGNLVGSAIVGASGVYAVHNLPAGSCTIFAYPLPATNYVAAAWGNVNNTLFGGYGTFGLSDGGTASGISLVLDVGATISGNVKGLGDPDINLQGVFVVAYNSFYGGTVGAYTDVNGNYTLNGVFDGSYTVRFNSPSPPYVTQFWDQSYNLAGASYFPLSTGQVITGKNAVLPYPFFADVTDPDSAFFAYIQWMYAEGISTGTPNPPFNPLYNPTGTVSRQAMATFLFRLSNNAFLPPPTAHFADVPTTSSQFTAIEWMYSAGITTGTPNPPGLPLFNPSAPVSRSAMALFLARYAGATLTPPTVQVFADVPIDSGPAAAITWMYDAGISTGTPAPPGLPLYNPSAPVSRQAMAAFLYRVDHLSP
jgi:S-layer homology domain